MKEITCQTYEENQLIICDDPPFILFSMNKTGTSSMDVALDKYFDDNKYRSLLLRKPIFKFYLRPIRRKRILNASWNSMPGLKHASPLWVLRNKGYLLGNKNWDNYYKACFIRNPFDRLLSVYSFHTQKISHEFPVAKEAGSFKNWLLIGGTGSAKKSMKKFLLDKNGRLLVDFIGRYENINHDWNLFLKNSGLGPVNLPAKERTKTNHADWHDVWTEELRDIFFQNLTWKNDYEYFGYNIQDS